MRILHLLSATGNNAYYLSKGEKENGASSRVLTDDISIYDRRADVVFDRFNINYLNRLCALIYCLIHISEFDVIHYNSGNAIFKADRLWMMPVFGLDVKLFRKMGKVIAVTYQGSDARQVSYCREHYDPMFYPHIDMDIERKRDLLKKEKISIFEKYADLIYAINPDLLNVLPKRAKFRPYTKLEPSEWTPCYSDYEKKKTTILHAPTRSEIKGTKYINAAIERLQGEGYDIEYLLLQNIPNNQAVEYYKKADLAIDQLQIGWYGGFAVECMALGKPVICYIRESDMHYIPKEMNEEMPIIRTDKDGIYHCLKGILDDKKQLVEIAHRSRQYVEKWHTPQIIAEKIMDDYSKCLQSRKDVTSITPGKRSI